MLQQQGTCEHDVDYYLTVDGLVIFMDKIYVPDNRKLKKLILQEFHVNSYSGHPGYQKTLTMVKKFYHDVFHVLLLKIYVKDINHVIDWFVL